MKNRLLILLIALLGTLSSAYGQSYDEFKSTLVDCGMIIIIPDGFIESKINNNDDMAPTDTEPIWKLMSCILRR